METFFPLDKAYKYGAEIGVEISQKIMGRAIFGTMHDAGVLAQMVANGIHGDHVEIGSLFGGTAILAAKVKKEFKLHGKVYCVDPLEYRPDVMIDRGTNSIATSTLLMENAHRFGVEDRIIHIAKHSYPWPLPDHQFTTGFVDGDHFGKTPAQDWESLSKHVTYSIALHDYMPHKPDVIDIACRAVADPRWILIHASGVTVVFRKRH